MDSAFFLFFKKTHFPFYRYPNDSYHQFRSLRFLNGTVLITIIIGLILLNSIHALRSEITDPPYVPNITCSCPENPFKKWKRPIVWRDCPEITEELIPYSKSTDWVVKCGYMLVPIKYEVNGSFHERSPAFSLGIKRLTRWRDLRDPSKKWEETTPSSYDSHRNDIVKQIQQLLQSLKNSNSNETETFPTRQAYRDEMRKAMELLNFENYFVDRHSELGDADVFKAPHSKRNGSKNISSPLIDYFLLANGTDHSSWSMKMVDQNDVFETPSPEMYIIKNKSITVGDPYQVINSDMIDMWLNPLESVILSHVDKPEMDMNPIVDNSFMEDLYYSPVECYQTTLLKDPSEFESILHSKGIVEMFDAPYFNPENNQYQVRYHLVNPFEEDQPKCYDPIKIYNEKHRFEFLKSGGLDWVKFNQSGAYFSDFTPADVKTHLNASSPADFIINYQLYNRKSTPSHLGYENLYFEGVGRATKLNRSEARNLKQPPGLLWDLFLTSKKAKILFRNGRYYKRTLVPCPRLHIWMLQDGIGEPVLSYRLLNAYSSAIKEPFHVFIPDYRGSVNFDRRSFSSPLVEDLKKEEWVTNVNTIRRESTGLDQASFDVLFMIERINELYPRADTRHFLHSASFSSLWAQRIMAINSSLIHGLILDSALSPSFKANEVHPVATVEMIRNLIHFCRQDQYCSKMDLTEESFFHYFDIIRQAVERGESKTNECINFVKKSFKYSSESSSLIWWQEKMLFQLLSAGVGYINPPDTSVTVDFRVLALSILYHASRCKSFEFFKKLFLFVFRYKISLNENYLKDYHKPLRLTFNIPDRPPNERLHYYLLFNEFWSKYLPSFDDFRSQFSNVAAINFSYFKKLYNRSTDFVEYTKLNSSNLFYAKKFIGDCKFDLRTSLKPGICTDKTLLIRYALRSPVLEDDTAAKKFLVSSQRFESFFVNAWDGNYFNSWSIYDSLFSTFRVSSFSKKDDHSCMIGSEDYFNSRQKSNTFLFFNLSGHYGSCENPNMISSTRFSYPRNSPSSFENGTLLNNQSMELPLLSCICCKQESSLGGWSKPLASWFYMTKEDLDATEKEEKNYLNNPLKYRTTDFYSFSSKDQRAAYRCENSSTAWINSGWSIAEINDSMQYSKYVKSSILNNPSPSLSSFKGNLPPYSRKYVSAPHANLLLIHGSMNMLMPMSESQNIMMFSNFNRIDYYEYWRMGHNVMNFTKSCMIGILTDFFNFSSLPWDPEYIWPLPPSFVRGSFESVKEKRLKSLLSNSSQLIDVLKDFTCRMAQDSMEFYNSSNVDSATIIDDSESEREFLVDQSKLKLNLRVNLESILSEIGSFETMRSLSWRYLAYRGVNIMTDMFGRLHPFFSFAPHNKSEDAGLPRVPRCDCRIVGPHLWMEPAAEMMGGAKSNPPARMTKSAEVYFVNLNKPWKYLTPTEHAHISILMKYPFGPCIPAKTNSIAYQAPGLENFYWHGIYTNIALAEGSLYWYLIPQTGSRTPFPTWKLPCVGRSIRSPLDINNYEKIDESYIYNPATWQRYPQTFFNYYGPIVPLSDMFIPFWKEMTSIKFTQEKDILLRDCFNSLITLDSSGEKRFSISSLSSSNCSAVLTTYYQNIASPSTNGNRMLSRSDKINQMKHWTEAKKPRSFIFPPVYLDDCPFRDGSSFLYRINSPIPHGSVSSVNALYHPSKNNGHCYIGGLFADAALHKWSLYDLLILGTAPRNLKITSDWAEREYHSWRRAPRLFKPESLKSDCSWINKNPNPMVYFRDKVILELIDSTINPNKIIMRQKLRRDKNGQASLTKLPEEAFFDSPVFCSCDIDRGRSYSALVPNLDHQPGESADIYSPDVINANIPKSWIGYPFAGLSVDVSSSTFDRLSERGLKRSFWRKCCKNLSTSSDSLKYSNSHSLSEKTQIQQNIHLMELLENEVKQSATVYSKIAYFKSHLLLSFVKQSAITLRKEIASDLSFFYRNTSDINNKSCKCVITLNTKFLLDWRQRSLMDYLGESEYSGIFDEPLIVNWTLYGIILGLMALLVAGVVFFIVHKIVKRRRIREDQRIWANIFENEDITDERFPISRCVSDDYIYRRDFMNKPEARFSDIFDKNYRFGVSADDVNEYQEYDFNTDDVLGKNRGEGSLDFRERYYLNSFMSVVAPLQSIETAPPNQSSMGNILVGQKKTPPLSSPRNGQQIASMRKRPIRMEVDWWDSDEEQSLRNDEDSEEEPMP